MDHTDASRILVLLDGSSAAERAIPYAHAMVAPGDEIVLMRVIPEPDPVLVELLWALDTSQDEEDISTARDDLLRVRSQRINPCVHCVVEVAAGDPAEQILRVIDQMDISSVVMTTRGRGTIDRVLFGSVADRIARASPVPVLLVRPEHSTGVSRSADIRRIVVPLDGSPWAAVALPRAIELSQQLMVPIHLVRVIDCSMMLAPVMSGGLFAVASPRGVTERMTDELTVVAETYLTSVATRLQERGVDASWAVLHGSPHFEIAHALQAGDLLVMTSHGRGGVMRWMLGSVAEKLVRSAPAPVLLVPSALRGFHDKTTGNRDW